MKETILPIKRSSIFDNIQYLRGVAVVLVVLSHALDYRYSKFGAIGVGIFFVISGFIMTVTSWNAFGVHKAPGDFLVRRIERIFPLYWIALTIKMVIDTRHKDVVWVTGSYLLLPVLSPGGLIEPIHGVGWSLIWEMIFYYIFTFSLLLPRKLGIAFSMLSLIALTVLGYSTSFAEISWHGSSIFLLFMSGILIGVCTRSLPIDRERNGVPATVLALIALGIGVSIILLDIDGGWFEVLELVMAIFIIVAAAMGPNIAPNGRFLGLAHLIGDASYSIYLTHTIFFSLVRSVFKVLKMQWVVPLAWLPMVLIGCVIGTFVYLVLEKRMIHFFKSFRSSRVPKLESDAHIKSKC